MNIFFLDQDPITAASYLADKHLSKMQLESAQLLSTTANILMKGQVQGLYKSAYINHPSRIWLEDSKENAVWLLEHCRGMNLEFQLRGHKEHKSYAVCEAAADLLLALLPERPMSLIPSCMPPEFYSKGVKYNDLATTVINYRNYYTKDKSHIHKLSSDNMPWM